jgi:hypothetical protein
MALSAIHFPCLNANDNRTDPDYRGGRMRAASPNALPLNNVDLEPALSCHDASRRCRKG